MKSKSPSSLGIVSFMILIGLIIIGFFGGDQRLIDAYPEHEGLVMLVADIVRIAIWVILIIVIIVIGITLVGIFFSR